MATYSHPSCFFWDTDLPNERQQQIIDWVASLPKDNQKMIDEMLDDCRRQAIFDYCESQ